VKPHRAELKARQAALRAELDRRREKARAALDAKKPPRRRRRWWWLLPLLLLLLMLLVPECYCTQVPLDPEPVGVGEPQPTVPGEPVPPEPPLPGGRVPRKDRPALPTPAPEPLPWLASFEMQVSARGPRLAACFEGTRHPGALRWSAIVEAGSGTVSDHVLDPVLDADPPDARQRACLIEVLSTPRYNLSPLDDRSTPPKVSLVIEF